MIRVLIVDDHALLREGLKQLFEYAGDIEVGAEATTGEEALAALKKERYDLVLLDISIPGLHGVELVSRIRENPDNPPILMLSMYNEPQIAKRKLKAGAMGYITKNSAPSDLMEAIRKVAAGGRYIAASIAEQIIFFDTDGAAGPATHASLTARELSILQLLVKGHKTTAIARGLGISVKTVSTHKFNIKQKMNIGNDADLMRYAITNGL